MSDSLADELAYRMERGEPWVLDWDDGSPGPDRELLARVVRALRETEQIQAAADQLRQAVYDEGPEIVYHRKVMSVHRSQWPTLWKAIDGLIGRHR